LYLLHLLIALLFTSKDQALNATPSVERTIAEVIWVSAAMGYVIEAKGSTSSFIFRYPAEVSFPITVAPYLNTSSPLTSSMVKFIVASLAAATAVAPDANAPTCAAVIPVGVPVKAGLFKGAFKLSAVCVAEDIGLFASLVLSTFPRPTNVLSCVV
jgi:hypothetical protein